MRSNIYLNYSLLLYLFLGDEIVVKDKNALKNLLRVLLGVSDRRARQLIHKLHFEVKEDVDGIHLVATKYLKEQFRRKKNAILKYVRGITIKIGDV